MPHPVRVRFSCSPAPGLPPKRFNHSRLTFYRASWDASIVDPPRDNDSSHGAMERSQSSTTRCPGQPPKDLELQRKRARDRKSQQAMRDRTKWTIHTLTEQVTVLSTVLDQKSSTIEALESKISYLESEITHIHTQNAALQLSMMRRNKGDNGRMVETSRGQAECSPNSVINISSPLWEISPRNSQPNCLADQILQGFVDAWRSGEAFTASSPREFSKALTAKPNMSSLLDGQRCSDDDISNVVADIVRTYREIEGLPKQVAVFYVMATLLNWMVLLDKCSWDLMPDWLKPVPSQLATAHSAWIDRIPWPRAREYLIFHPEITLDDFAAPYSSGFNLHWPYDPSSVLLAVKVNGDGTSETTINPVYEEHIRKISNWTVGDVFRRKFPELSHLIDLDSGQHMGYI